MALYVSKAEMCLNLSTVTILKVVSRTELIVSEGVDVWRGYENVRVLLLAVSSAPRTA